jgi:hypothetical protein
MGNLFDTIRRRVTNGSYVVGQHASERLEERGILEWQVVDGIDEATLLSQRPADQPNPSVEVEQILADGTKVKVIWSHIISADLAKFVTVHFFDD